MDESEAAGLGRELGLRLPADTTARLTRRTDGWPALLALATLGARTPEGGPKSIDAGSDRLVEDYLRSEVLGVRSEAEIEFLTRTSIVERLSAPLCDAIIEGRGSTSVLRQLAQSTLLVDDYGGAYRYHTLLRDFLQRELTAREPEAIPTLHRRAAAWYRENNAYEPAVDHAFAAGDLDLAATFVGNGWQLFHWSGRRATIRAWATRFGADALVARPWLAVLAAWEELAAGDVAGAVRFADVAERGTFEGRPPDGTASFEAGLAMLRAAMVRRGAADALANATRAVELEGNLGSWRDFALWQLAIARLTVGDQAGADAAFADGIEAARSSGHAAIRFCILGHRALAAAGVGAWEAAAAFIEESDAIEPAPQVDGYLSSIPSRTARISLATHRGDVAGVRRELAHAMSLRPLMTAAAPAAAVMCLDRVRPGLPCGGRPGWRARPRRAGAGRDPRAPRSRGVAGGGGRALGDLLPGAAYARRGSHEPHGRGAPGAHLPALLPLLSRRSDSDSASGRRRSSHRCSRSSASWVRQTAATPSTWPSTPAYSNASFRSRRPCYRGSLRFGAIAEGIAVVLRHGGMLLDDR